MRRWRRRRDIFSILMNIIIVVVIHSLINRHRDRLLRWKRWWNFIVVVTIGSNRTWKWDRKCGKRKSIAGRVVGSSIGVHQDVTLELKLQIDFIIIVRGRFFILVVVVVIPNNDCECCRRWRRAGEGGEDELHEDGDRGRKAPGARELHQAVVGERGGVDEAAVAAAGGGERDSLRASGPIPVGDRLDVKTTTVGNDGTMLHDTFFFLNPKTDNT